MHEYTRFYLCHTNFSGHLIGKKMLKIPGDSPKKWAQLWIEGFALLNSDTQLVQSVVYRAPDSVRTTHCTGATTACTVVRT